MKQIYLTLIFALATIGLQAQVTTCGTEPSAEHLEELTAKVKQMNERSFSGRSQTRNIPVKVHIVRKSNQQSSIDMNKVTTEFDKLNDLFAGANMEFYLSNETDYIDSDRFYNLKQSEEADMAGPRDVQDAINIYFVGSITNGQGNTICGYTYYPNSNKDRVIISNNCLENTTTLAHELGHYFSLIHTHGISGIESETVNGENCEQAGDLLCDTPADPNLDGEVSNNCNYTGNATDVNGTPYQPRTDNIMSYAPAYCRGLFTQEQLNVMAITYEEDRSYLVADDNYSPVSNVVAGNDMTASTNELSVKLYPNPSANRVGVQLQDGFEGSFQIKVFDMTGRLVQQQAPRDYFNGSMVELDLANQGSGIYLINIVSKNQQVTKKVMLK